MVQAIENFFGVYLLYCTNPRFKGRTYIGFTVDPNRRVKQHNTGKQAGGAWRTHGRGPWDMVLIVHGFPNMISALRFEWAWQNPHKSRRLKHVGGKKKSETPYDFRIRVVCEMLQCGPWTRLPLTFRWLKQEYKVDFDPSRMPPKHMPIAYGPVKALQVKPPKDNEESQPLTSKCDVCHIPLKSTDTTLPCVSRGCRMKAHILCLANHFLHSSDVFPSSTAPSSSSNDYPSQRPMLPIDGVCPVCRNTILWGDLLRAKKGCYQHEQASSDEDEDHWANDLQSQVH